MLPEASRTNLVHPECYTTAPGKSWHLPEACLAMRTVLSPALKRRPQASIYNTLFILVDSIACGNVRRLAHQRCQSSSLWDDVCQQYAKLAGISPLDRHFPQPETLARLLDLLEEEQAHFDDFRQKKRRFFHILQQVLAPLNTFGDLLETILATSLPPGPVIMGAILVSQTKLHVSYLCFIWMQYVLSFPLY